MEQMTVKALMEFCKEQIAAGNGDKMIVVADDNEGNGYHGLFWQFSPADDFVDIIYDSKSTDPNKIIVLG
jgi:hypothetical protein